MPIGVNNAVPGDPNIALARRVAELERLVKELAASNTLQAATISQGTLQITGGNLVVNGGSIQLTSGGDLVVDGGDVIFKDTTGTILFRIGLQNFGDRGVTFYRADGSKTWTIAKVFGAGDTSQKYQVYDSLGKVISGDSALSASGFDAPNIPVIWRPLDRSDAKTLPNTVALNTWTSLFESQGVRNNPAVPLTFSVLCSDATTAGQIRVIDVSAGNPIAGFLASPWLGTIPAGTTTATNITSPALGLPGSMADSNVVQVQVQRTAGTGTISVSIVKSIGGGY